MVGGEEQCHFNYRNRYSKYGSYNNSIYNNYLNRNQMVIFPIIQGKRGSSKELSFMVMVIQLDQTVEITGNASGVTYYNVGRSSTLQDDNVRLIIKILGLELIKIL